MILDADFTLRMKKRYCDNDLDTCYVVTTLPAAV
jgi:hypothetical protein